MINVRRLTWDPWNVAHIARHQVSPEEVEQVCHGEFVLRQSYGGRLLLIGPTLGDRMLAIVLEDLSEGRYHVVTARSADRKELRIYFDEKEGGS